MKITDEMILEAARRSFYETEDFDFAGFFGEVSLFARELIALAQQVKPLQFKRHEEGGLEAASGGVYFYSVYDWVTPKGYVYDINGYISELHDTEAEAIAAAQQDYQRRVLGCLVNGGE